MTSNGGTSQPQWPFESVLKIEWVVHWVAELENANGRKKLTLDSRTECVIKLASRLMPHHLETISHVGLSSLQYDLGKGAVRCGCGMRGM